MGGLAIMQMSNGTAARQQLAQHFRLLPEFPRGRGRGEEGLQTVYAVVARRRRERDRVSRASVAPSPCSSLRSARAGCASALMT